jgi:mono/diheme cytochrome c family protein
LAYALAPVAALGFAGCDGSLNPSYPSEMRYPQRDDLIVLTPPKNSILFPFAEPPGSLEETIAKVATLEEGTVADPKKMVAKDRKELATFLDKAFGTPAKPTVKIDDDDAMAMAETLKLDGANLEAGSKLYRRHCLQCHGIAGDGRGPSGPWLHPHPRDYRQGLFKFISSDPADPLIGQERKPRREDLHHVLTYGAEGTSMPSFALLSEHELQALISYVTHLSIRGEVELFICKQVIAGRLQNDVESDAETWTKIVINRWKTSNERPLTAKNPAGPASNSQRLESVQRGYDYFTNAKVGNCVSCHFDFGRQAQFRYDAWGTLVRPNNLTNGVYRGGRRPLDLYYRIAGGINPCAMPKNDDEAKVWDMVNFVQSLPYPEMLPEDVRDKVYPGRYAEKLAER